ncbi:MAG: hypothetical protein FJ137_14155 [Deltaproteobacteria bacterium]|nr:hypothetical protein [Deltaproteobacteria bacterium]
MNVRPTVAFTVPSLLRLAAVASLAVIPLGACDCTEITVRVAPQIYVDVCAKPVKTVDNKVIGGFQECALPFGEADLSVKVAKTVVITNPSNLELKLESVELEGDPSFDFVEPPPDRIGPGLSAQVAVQIRPRVESAIEAELVIISDANNTPKNEDDKSEIRIPITLTGVDRGVPDIEVVPVGCGTTAPLGIDFGNVSTSGLQVCNVEVRNVGTRELYFDFLDFVPDANGERIITEPGDSGPVPSISLTGAIPDPETPLRPTSDEHAPLTLRVAFAPDALGRYGDTLRIVSSDPDEDVVEVPIQGIGVTGPQCVARIKSVNDVEIEGAAAVEPLDDVVLTTIESTGATPEVGIASTRWELRERGPGSGVVLSSPSTAETGFLFANRRGVDVAGRYEACAVVTDELGTESVNECCVKFDAIPSDAFLVQLTWAEPTGDMDLHVTKKSDAGEYCLQGLGSPARGVQAPYDSSCATGLDCYYGNCKPSSFGGAPEWDDVTGRTDGDPSLDIDDLTGFGPENTNVNQVVAGSYAFGADFFSGSGAHTMFIRLFIYGQLKGEWVATIEDEFWEVGIVHFRADNLFQPCIEDLTDGDPSDQCPDD